MINKDVSEILETNQQTQSIDVYRIFAQSCRTAATRRSYTKGFEYFLDYFKNRQMVEYENTIICTDIHEVNHCYNNVGVNDTYQC
jgi:hypothetical protein